MEIIDKTLNLNTPTKKKDMKLYEEMMSDIKNVYCDGVSGNLLYHLKQKYTSNKFVMSEMIEQITNYLNCHIGMNEVLKKQRDELDICIKDMNSNMDEIIEYEVSKRSGNGYWSEESEIGILKNDIECLEREKKELEKKVEDWERMMNLKTERMRDISEEDWVNGRY